MSAVSIAQEDMQQAVHLFGGQYLLRALVLAVASAAPCRLQIHFYFPSYRFLCRLDSSLASQVTGSTCVSLVFFNATTETETTYVLTKRWYDYMTTNEIKTHVLVLRMDFWFDSFVRSIFPSSFPVIWSWLSQKSDRYFRHGQREPKGERIRCNWISVIGEKEDGVFYSLFLLSLSLFIFTPG